MKQLSILYIFDILNFSAKSFPYIHIRNHVCSFNCFRIASFLRWHRNQTICNIFCLKEENIFTYKMAIWELWSQAFWCSDHCRTSKISYGLLIEMVFQELSFHEVLMLIFLVYNKQIQRIIMQCTTSGYVACRQFDWTIVFNASDD